MSAGIGSVVGLYMDTPRKLAEGDYIQTPTERTYEITSVRQQTRGKHTGRWHLRALVIPADAIPEGATVHPLAWYRR